MIPGGAPFSQLNKGVKDAMVESTGLVERQFMTKTCKKAIISNNKIPHIEKIEEGNHPQIRTKLQKRALVKSYRQHLRRSNK